MPKAKGKSKYLQKNPAEIGEVEKVILIDSQNKKRKSFDSFEKLAKHLGKKTDILAIAQKTLWISQRYQIEIIGGDYTPISFYSPSERVVYRDVCEAWKKNVGRSKGWNANHCYAKIQEAIANRTYHFEYSSHRYQLLDDKGHPRQSEITLVDILPSTPIEEKLEKVVEKALSISESMGRSISPFYVASTVHIYKPQLLTEHEVETIYQRTRIRH